MTETDLRIVGMTCASCVARVERALGRVPGVSKATVNLATERARITHDETAERGALRDAILDAGFDVEEIDATPEAASPPAPSRDRFDLLLATVLTLPLVIFSMAGMAGGSIGHAFMGWAGLAFAAPVVLVAGRRFFRNAAGELRHRAAGMSTLVVLGSTTALAWSVVVLAFPRRFQDSGHTYFEASAAIVTLVLVGKHLESLAKARASRALTKILALGFGAKTVRRRENGVERDIPTSDIAAGDELVVRPGERFAVDGVVLEGSGFVDESMLTGEPMPVAKTRDGVVRAGTVNGTSALVVRARQVGKDTLLAQIARAVEDAQSSKAEAQALADRIAAIFVPVIVGVAVLTFAGWMLFGPAPAASRAIAAAVSVLVVACPCAMGLATPAAIIVATGRAAQAGIVFRTGTALGALSRVDTVLLDKTGTLTEGHPEVTRVVLAPGAGITEAELLRLASAAERKSEHPLARAIVARASVAPTDADAAHAEAAHAEDVRAEPGAGVRATIEGHDITIGSRSWLERSHVEANELGALEKEARADEPDASVVLTAIDGRLVGAFAIRDVVRSTSAEAIAALRARGMRVVLVSGDGAAAASAVASAVGIDEVVANQLPLDKQELVKHLRGEGREVAFAGDGINDAPALAEASCGIAMGGGTDIAIEAADVVLVRSDPRAIVAAIVVARRASRTIRQNFFWAYAYNVALVPIAAGVLGFSVSPTLAAGAMSLSSLFVLGNSLRQPALPA